jgi:hypothetical protein
MLSKDLPAKDTAREFFVLAHAIIVSEMSLRAVPRRRVEPEDTDPIHFWFAWRAQQRFGNPAEIYR